MGNTDIRHQYYAAGILWWVGTQPRNHFTLRDLTAWQFANDDDDPHWFKPVLSDVRLTSAALQFLERMGAVSIVKDQYGPTAFEVEGRPLSELADELPESPFGRVERFKGQWIEDAISNINDLSMGDANPLDVGERFELDLTDSVDQLRLLTIDRSTDTFSEVVAGLEAAIREIKADNEFASEFQHERNNIVQHAEATLASVKEGKVSKSQVRSNLIQVGLWIAKNTVKPMLAKSAENLVDWAMKLWNLLQ